MLTNLEFAPGKSYALEMDHNDLLAPFRDRFHFPLRDDGSRFLYLCGNSLGLQPDGVEEYILQELADWRALGVEGHFNAAHPWMPYHEFVSGPVARLVGAEPSEVVTMNSLTVNLHLMMVSFYRPTRDRYKILIEANAFPSDQYAVKSQIRYHGYDPDDALIELPLRPDESIHHAEDIAALIEEEGDRIALILIGGVNYYSGQVFDMASITKSGHRKGCLVGFDLAHAAGNVQLELHQWNVDFAVWCTYKYLNSGPGSIAGCFVHERHARDGDLPRFAGWWGHDKNSRFRMGPEYIPIPGAEGWQLSNPPILPLAALRASLAIFDEAGMDRLVAKSRALSGYMQFLLDQLPGRPVKSITPRDPQHRGCQLSLVVPRNGKKLHEGLTDAGVICDWREPDVIRVAAVPLYNSFEDVYAFIETMKRLLHV